MSANYLHSDLDQLRNFISAVIPLPETEWLKFAGLWKPFSTGRKQVLTSPGDQEKYLYFVLEGVQRVYFCDEQGREATLVLTYTPSFGGVLDAMLSQQPSRYWYETLSPSRFLRAPYSEINLLRNFSKEIAEMIHLMLSSAMSGLLERMVELQCFNSEQKFRALLNRSPHVLQQVPHKYLANYLGIDPTNFSKLINKVVI